MINCWSNLVQIQDSLPLKRRPIKKKLSHGIPLPFMIQLNRNQRGTKKSHYFSDCSNKKNCICNCANFVMFTAKKSVSSQPDNYCVRPITNNLCLKIMYKWKLTLLLTTFECSNSGSTVLITNEKLFHWV